MKQSQESWVIARLKEDGFITRNQALQAYISRLGAIIFNLSQDGWKIEGAWIKTANGRDYKYTLIEAKKKKVYDFTYEIRDGQRIAVPVAKMVVV